nr:MFS transporter [Yersinia aldovae]
MTLSLLFFIHGIAYASLVPWIPYIKENLNMSNSMVGMTISAIPAGAIIFGLISSNIISLLGQFWATNITFILFIICISLIPFASSWYEIALLLFLFGIFDAWTDTCMNVQALDVQKTCGQSLINRFHGAESIGTILGGLVAVSAIGFGLTMGQFSTTIFFINISILMGFIFLFKRKNERNNNSILHKRGLFIGTTGLPLYCLALVLLVFTCGIEETASIWGAIYMNDYYHVSPIIAGLPYLACQVSMVIGRMSGDYFTNKFGVVSTIKYGIMIATLGIWIVISIHSSTFSILGFSLIGLGISVTFPLTIAFIGQIPNLNSANGVMFATWISRIGLLISPPLIGMLADITSLRTALILILICCVFIYLLINMISRKII